MVNSSDTSVKEKEETLQARLKELEEELARTREMAEREISAARQRLENTIAQANRQVGILEGAAEAYREMISRTTSRSNGQQ